MHILIVMFIMRTKWHNCLNILSIFFVRICNVANGNLGTQQSNVFFRKGSLAASN